MQIICTPCCAACSIKPRCFSMFSRLMSSIGKSVGAAFVHWMSPHLTVRGIFKSSLVNLSDKLQFVVPTRENGWTLRRFRHDGFGSLRLVWRRDLHQQ